MKVAGLTCDRPNATDWSTVGTFYITHPGIVPSTTDTPAVYQVQIMDEGCDPDDPDSFATLEVTNSLFGDICGGFDPAYGEVGAWVAPDRRSTPTVR